MKRAKSPAGKSGQPHSERAGDAALESGGRTTLYRALRELTCSRCGAVIREGELFTRGAATAAGLPLIRSCRGCAPFEPAGGLLEALFAAGSGREPADAADAREKVLSRLGPALAAGRKRRGGPAS
ncbi:MAG TPA: hypothetical protein VF659_02945 [Pyrinomonadaceae bacterium]|jgi:hypothetical protein